MNEIATNEQMNQRMTQLQNAFLKRGCPPRMWGGMARYLFNGVPPGHFLSAVISNDLRGAIERADDENVNLLREYVMFLYNDCPMGCWGSAQNFGEWVERGGFNGR